MKERSSVVQERLRAVLEGGLGVGVGQGDRLGAEGEELGQVDADGHLVADEIAVALAGDESGEWSGRAPFGYSVDKETKTLRPNDAAALVPVIFDTYVAGQLGATAIAHWLNRSGRRSVADNLWDGRSVIRVLRNPAYVGKVRHDDTEYDGRHEPLIDQAVFDAAQKLLDERGGDIYRHPKSAYVLGGLTRCRDCQGAFIGQSAYGKSKRVYRYYVCRTQATKGKRACHAQRVSADALEKAVIASLVDTYSDVDLFQEAHQSRGRGDQRHCSRCPG